MKKLKLISVLLLLLVLCGCDNNDIVEESSPTFKKIVLKDTEFYIYDDYQIPVDLGYPLLNDDDYNKTSFSSKEEITNLVDLIRYLDNFIFDLNPDKTADIFIDYLENDYDEVGKIYINTNKVNFSFVYVFTNNKYYLIDSYQLSMKTSKKYLSNFLLDKYSFENIEELKETLYTTFPYKDLDDEVIDVSYNSVSSVINDKISYAKFIIGDDEVYEYNGLIIPCVLGYPELKNEDFIKDDFIPAKDIKNLIDCYNYLIFSNDIGGINDPQVIFRYFNTYISDNYDDVGKIRVCTDKNSNLNFDLMYIKQSDKYYLIDLFGLINNSRTLFLNNNLDEIGFDNLEDINTFIINNFRYKDDAEIAKIVLTSSTHSLLVELDNGSYTNATLSHGAYVYDWAGVQIPLGLGTPQYTDEQIDEIIAKKDYRNIKNIINTYPDLINYMIRSNFQFSGKEDLYFGNTHFIDVGNIFYNGGSEKYTLSGLQLLMINKGQCTSLSTMFNYVLKDNYPEIGYMDIEYNDGDGHAMVYILGNDNKYYLVNPVQYVVGYNRKSAGYEWCEFYNYNENGVSDTLSGLMKTFMNSNNPAKSNVRVAWLYTIVSDDVFVVDGHDGYLSTIDGSKTTAWSGTLTGYFSKKEYADMEYIFNEYK